MEYPFADAAWNALHTAHRHLAVSKGLACKYPADVAPFAAVAEASTEAFSALLAIMQPGEYTWLFRHPPVDFAGLTHEMSLPVLQMLFPATASLPEAKSTAEIVPLGASHGPEMVTLTDVAFPGFFRERTYVMGDYFGIRDAEGKLVAMCGERLVVEGWDGTIWREISGLCTHPEHRGKGYGGLLLRKLLELQRAQDAVSVLHVTATNLGPIGLYRELGFIDIKEFLLHKVVHAA